MNVSQLAEEFKTTDEFILKTLKSLKLKAKGATQELNVVVVSVLKGELSKKDRLPPRGVKEKKPLKEGEDSKVAEKKVKEKDEETESEEELKKSVVKKKKTVVKKKKIVKTKAKEEEKKDEKSVEEKKVEGEKEEVKKEEKKVVVKKKPVTRLSQAPLITLKPLARKKRKTAPTKDKAETINFSSNNSDKEESSSVELNAGKAERDESLPDIEVDIPISVKDLSTKLQQKPSIILTKLMKMGLMCHINQLLDEEMVSRLTKDFGFNLAKIRTQEEQLIEVHKQEEEDPSLLKQRAPVITFMGHVDHGKTSLVDWIRKSKVASGEHGGITQHMSAYSVEMPKGRITFLDTPGHAAFTAMRARGAHITDLIVLVVAADDGVMPQTREAIDHARAAKVPIVVALNKIDLPTANLDKVKQQLAELNLASEDWGGSTVVAPVSATTGEGIDDLLELILLEAEMLELTANPDKRASGLIVEAHLSQGRGAVTTVIVQSGTLRTGDIVVVGPHYGKVKAMFDDHNNRIKEAGPSMPVEILGLAEVPDAGDSFYIIEDERKAKDICFIRQEELKNKKIQGFQKVTMDNLYARLETDGVKEMNVIIKADMQGSLEALKDSLAKIPSEKARVNFIHLGVGDINASDIVLAMASKAVIIAFHVGIGSRAKEELNKTPVDIREYRIIYDAVDDMHNALEGLLEAKIQKNFLGRVEIREVFKLSKQGIVAGCYLSKGKVHRKAHIDILRRDEIVFSGTISSLKRFKDDVKDVSEGMECGITINGFDKFQAGDIIEAYDIESIAQKL